MKRENYYFTDLSFGDNVPDDAELVMSYANDIIDYWFDKHTDATDEEAYEHTMYLWNAYCACGTQFLKELAYIVRIFPN